MEREEPKDEEMGGTSIAEEPQGQNFGAARPFAPVWGVGFWEGHILDELASSSASEDMQLSDD